jgi:hypothetical protein
VVWNLKEAESKRYKTKAPDKHCILYLNAPYLWAADDCSGFTQMVYKLNGYKLLRCITTGYREKL